MTDGTTRTLISLSGSAMPSLDLTQHSGAHLVRDLGNIPRCAALTGVPALEYPSWNPRSTAVDPARGIGEGLVGVPTELDWLGRDGRRCPQTCGGRDPGRSAAKAAQLLGAAGLGEPGQPVIVCVSSPSRRYTRPTVHGTLARWSCIMSESRPAATSRHRGRLTAWNGCGSIARRIEGLRR
jgi:hypothetical protein